jgi:ethanolamine utilization protein EutA (predicted chaperonin)
MSVLLMPLLTLALLLTANSASAVFVQRYQSIANGAIVFTGNTLGLDRNGSNYAAGTAGSIGAFINSDTSANFSTFVAGSIGSTAASNTLWQNNKSEATLTLPSGGNIVYAELLWGGNSVAGGLVKNIL